MIQRLQDEFCRRFVDFRSHEQDLAIFPDPFSCGPETAPINMQIELIELQECTELKSSFRDLHLEQFYSELPAQTYPALRKHGHRMASLFGRTYICEKTFSIMNLNKSKWRKRLTDEHLHWVLRISTTNYEPRYPEMIDGKSQLLCHIVGIRYAFCRNNYYSEKVQVFEFAARVSPVIRLSGPHERKLWAPLR